MFVCVDDLLIIGATQRERSPIDSVSIFSEIYPVSPLNPQLCSAASKERLDKMFGRCRRHQPLQKVQFEPITVVLPLFVLITMGIGRRLYIP